MIVTTVNYASPRSTVVSNVFVIFGNAFLLADSLDRLVESTTNLFVSHFFRAYLATLGTNCLEILLQQDAGRPQVGACWFRLRPRPKSEVFGANATAR